MESENNLVGDLDRGAGERKASIQKVLDNMIPVVNPDGKVILYVYEEMQSGKRVDTEKKTEAGTKDGLWTSEQLYEWNMSHLKTEESAAANSTEPGLFAEAAVSMRMDEAGNAVAAVPDGTEDVGISEARASTSEGIFASLKTEEEEQVRDSISIATASEGLETQPVNDDGADDAEVDNESTWRQQALAFRLAFECKPLYGQLTLSQLTELVRKDYRDLYKESVTEAAVLACIRGMKKKLRVHYHRLCRKFQLMNCMFDCLRTILEEN